MTTPRPRIVRALEQFHATHPWDHNAHYHRWILRRLPRRFDTALDIGAGSGDLARLLASRAGAVHGIDVDPTILARARELTAPTAPVT
ncbi:class I SAM-dependent methyltransferase, partial [Streptomyces mirabilis]